MRTEKNLVTVPGTVACNITGQVYEGDATLDKLEVGWVNLKTKGGVLVFHENDETVEVYK